MELFLCLGGGGVSLGGAGVMLCSLGASDLGALCSIAELAREQLLVLFLFSTLSSNPSLSLMNGKIAAKFSAPSQRFLLFSPHIHDIW